MPVARPPKLLSQALLLLLPVVVLAIVGAVSLVRERAAAYHDARGEMRSSADKIAEVLGGLALVSEVRSGFTDIFVNAEGALVQPPPYPKIPPSNSGIAGLSPGGLPIAVLDAVSAGDGALAAEAAFKHPSAITPLILKKFAPERIREWEDQEASRALYDTLRKSPAPIWDGELISYRIPYRDGQFLLMHHTFEEIVASIPKLELPSYADARLTLQGQILVGKEFDGEVVSTSRDWPRVATPGGSGTLIIDIVLTRPEIISARFRNRALWLGGTIAAAALAALLGFLSTRRAFLQQQQLAAEKDNFVSSVSHELRAPVASMQIMAESLATDRVTSPEKRHEYYRLITDECRRLGSLVENVLDFSRLEAGRKTFAFEDTDLEALVIATTKLMEPQAAKKEVTIKTDLTPATATIDSAAIQRALINLLENAITHTPPGSTITAGVAPGKFWVEDQGPGIPEDERTKIFERFYRSGSELTRETEGVGIGLSIVKSIAEAHGGTVSVISSRFTITLP